jgi:hypothetical protein
MPLRRKPARFLRHWAGPVDRESVGASGKQFKTVLVYCVNCPHSGRLKLADLPD